MVTNNDPLSHDTRLADNHPIAHDLLADNLLLHNHLLRSDERLHAMRLGDFDCQHLRLVNIRGRKLHRSGVHRLRRDQLDRLTSARLLRHAEQRDGRDDGGDVTLQGITSLSWLVFHGFGPNNFTEQIPDDAGVELFFRRHL